MSTVLDVVGLLALVVAGFLIAVWLGCAIIGVGCLWVSWSMTNKTRKAAELEAARRARAIA